MQQTREEMEVVTEGWDMNNEEGGMKIVDERLSEDLNSDTGKG